jgi:hypothetical protein
MGERTPYEESEVHPLREVYIKHVGLSAYDEINNGLEALIQKFST